MSVRLPGDIVAILDSTGTKVVEYKYDAWGKQIGKTGSMASTLGTVQPFRYRGYVYDEETGLYYLRSRYYKPKWCRFVNADTFVLTSNELLFGNAFAYCCNQAICYTDANGYGPDQIAESDDPDEDFFPTEGGGGGSQSIAQSVLQGGNTYSSYGAFKYRHGKAGLGKHWHHLVEQCQIRLSNISAKLIYSVQNTIALDAALHQQISNFYSSKPDFTNGLTVRNWLSTMTFDEQYAWGLKFLDQILNGE